jgi:hypothetical protein
MRPFRIAALILMTVAIVLTGLGGTLDMYSNREITKKHIWNDGVFMGILAVFILLWDGIPRI